MEVDEIEAGLLEKFSSLQTVDQPGECLLPGLGVEQAQALSLISSRPKIRKALLALGQLRSD